MENIQVNDEIIQICDALCTTNSNWSIILPVSRHYIRGHMYDIILYPRDMISVLGSRAKPLQGNDCGRNFADVVVLIIDDDNDNFD